MNPHDDFQDALSLVRPRPLVVRIVHTESEQVVNEIPVDPAMTGPEFEQWQRYLENVCGPEYEIEPPPGYGSAA